MLVEEKRRARARPTALLHNPLSHSNRRPGPGPKRPLRTRREFAGHRLATFPPPPAFLSEISLLVHAHARCNVRKSLLPFAMIISVDNHNSRRNRGCFRLFGAKGPSLAWMHLVARDVSLFFTRNFRSFDTSRCIYVNRSERQIKNSSSRRFFFFFFPVLSVRKRFEKREFTISNNISLVEKLFFPFFFFNFPEWNSRRTKIYGVRNSKVSYELFNSRVHKP